MKNIESFYLPNFELTEQTKIDMNNFSKNHYNGKYKVNNGEIEIHFKSEIKKENKLLSLINYVLRYLNENTLLTNCLIFILLTIILCNFGHDENIYENIYRRRCTAFLQAGFFTFILYELRVHLIEELIDMIKDIKSDIN